MTDGNIPRPTDPRAGALCTACNRARSLGTAKHCDSPSCPWWKCERCGASNDPTGANDSTDRSGNTRPNTTPRSTR